MDNTNTVAERKNWIFKGEKKIPKSKQVGGFLSFSLLWLDASSTSINNVKELLHFSDKEHRMQHQTMLEKKQKLEKRNERIKKTLSECRKGMTMVLPFMYSWDTQKSGKW